MASDIKAMGGAVYKLPSEIFLRTHNRFDDPRCRNLLLSPTGKYTKFAPCLFPQPGDMVNSDFLKTAVLVEECITSPFTLNDYLTSYEQALHAAFFGKSSVGGGSKAPGPKCKAKLWGLRDTSAGMIAAAAVMVSVTTSHSKCYK